MTPTPDHLHLLAIARAAIETTPDPRDAVIARLVEALTPFDAVSIEMFSHNYNASDIVLTVGPVSGTCLTFRDFLNVRAALAAAKEVMK